MLNFNATEVLRIMAYLLIAGVPIVSLYIATRPAPQTKVEFFTGNQPHIGYGYQTTCGWRLHTKDGKEFSCVTNVEVIGDN